MTSEGGVAVIGAGIAGLAAAWELSAHQPVTVYDPDPPGGKLRTELFDGHPVDLGPDAFLTRVPQAVDLCAELGLTDELVAPTSGHALLWGPRGLQPLPEGLVLGAPRRLGGLVRSRVLSPAGLVRAGLDLVLPGRPAAGDVSVWDLVAGRFGPEVATRLVDPLVGGIHAGRTEDLSARATVPQLVAAAGRRRSLLLGLRSLPSPSGAPMFLTPRRGLGRLVEALVTALQERGVAFVGERVTAVAARHGRAVLATSAGEADHAGAVLTVPAAAAATLLGRAAPAGLTTIPTASVTMVLASFPAADLPAPEGISGFLVPRTTGRLLTAGSFASTKWPHWAAPGRTLVRLSAGRAGDERVGALSDEDVVARTTDELNRALGTSAAPVATRVVRWPDAFPQYVVGHQTTVAAIEAAVAGFDAPLAVGGSSYHGAGIPACIGSGRRAAAAVGDRLGAGVG